MTRHRSTEHLLSLREALASSEPPPGTYALPSLWVDPASAPDAPGIVLVDPKKYYSDLLGRILDSSPVGPVKDSRFSWSDRAVVYNMMIRTTCAFDHDQDGRIDVTAPGGSWRENGTFLKAIAILPYIRSLGANTIHLLPLFSIGEDGRRGSLGSPYAVRDFSSVDPMLAEPCIPTTPDGQFRAFLEAAHHYGFRVILEIPLRIVSKDSVWIQDHPEWFYWIREGMEFKPPVFSPRVLGEMKERVAAGDFSALPGPDPDYRGLFFAPPLPDSVRLEGKKYVGRTPDGVRVVLPGAFADWPPDDTQPVWEDVTYLKYYQDPAYNYISYNTVRMYDSSLTGGGSEILSLWGELVELVGRLASEYRIDGLMFDMAHAFPEKLQQMVIRKGREINEDFVFWAEDFSRHPGQRKAGYNAVLGGQWACQHRPGDFSDMLRWIARTPLLPPHLATPETHNTPRAAGREGGRTYARYAWALSNFIPAIPYIHSGFELCETLPINTGLGFTADDLDRHGGDSLPLFSEGTFNWSRRGNIVGDIRRVSGIRKTYGAAIVPAYESTRFSILEDGGENIIAFSRSDPETGTSLILAANADMGRSHHFRLHTGGVGTDGIDLLGGGTFEVAENIIRGELSPGQVVVFTGMG